MRAGPFTVVSSDLAPTISTTVPTDGATGVSTTADITISFSEAVNVTSTWYTITCGSSGSHTAAVTGGPTVWTLNPAADFAAGESCTVVLEADYITDQDTNDPPDNMASDYSWSFTTAAAAVPIIINELDSDTPGTDLLEFVELYDGGVGNTSLTGKVVVLYNGSNDLSYAAYDLDGYSTDASGYFVLGNSGVTGVDYVFNNDTLQNGADAAALYTASASDFPNNTAVTTSNLVDAIVYDTSDADDPGLLVLLNTGQPQVNEDSAGTGPTVSNQRCPNGSGGARNTSPYLQALPTAGAANNCLVCTTIPAIQGSGSSSACDGRTVATLSGCVTGVTATGFYMQDVAGDGNSATSDGIYVYVYSTWTNPQGIAVGYTATAVNGQVQEYYNATELYNPSSVSKGSVCSLPTPVAVTQIQTMGAHNVDQYEPAEFMRVSMDIDGYVQGPTKRFVSRFAHGDPEIGFIKWGNQNSIPNSPRLFEEDYTGYGGLNYLSGACNKDLPDVDFGDRIQGTGITGVMGYHFDKWQLIVDETLNQSLTVTNNADVTDDEPALGSSQWGICTYNLENMFDSIDDGDGDIGDWQPPDVATYNRMILKRALGMAVDLEKCSVIGVQEMEGKDQVWDDLEAAMEAAAPGSNFEWDYYESQDARDITVGILYDVSKVTLNSSTQRQGCTTTNYGVNYANAKGTRVIANPCGTGTYALYDRPPYVARLTATGVTNGPTFVVIVNHFKSMSTETYDTRVRREKQATHNVALALEYSQTYPNIAIVGDLNDYIGSTPIGILNAGTTYDGKALVNVHTAHIAKADQYTYNFSGESEVLDYVFLSSAFDTAHFLAASPMHINSDFPDVGAALRRQLRGRHLHFRGRRDRGRDQPACLGPRPRLCPVRHQPHGRRAKALRGVARGCSRPRAVGDEPGDRQPGL